MKTIIAIALIATCCLAQSVEMPFLRGENYSYDSELTPQQNEIQKEKAHNEYLRAYQCLGTKPLSFSGDLETDVKELIQQKKNICLMNSCMEFELYHDCQNEMSKNKVCSKIQIENGQQVLNNWISCRQNDLSRQSI